MADHDRDRAIERLLPQVLGGAASTPCVDGETLAAWSDGALRESEAARVEAHVADCARCQAMLGAFVRITPVPMVTEPVWQRWRLGWLLPLATAAAAVALWAVLPMTSVRQESQVALSDASRDTPAPAPTPEPPSPPAAQREAFGAGASPAAPPPAVPSGEAPAAPPGRGQVMNDERRAADALAKQARDERDERADAAGLEKPAEAPRALAESVTVTAASPPVDTAQTLASQRARNEAPSQPAPVTERKAVEERVAIAKPAPPAPPPPAAAPVAAPAAPAIAAETAIADRGTAGRLARMATVAIVSIPSPAQTARWRIVDARRIERATTADRFEPVVLPEPATLTAGAAPSATVCWVIGRGGRVFLTLDGQRFARVAFPESVDLVAVAATDARTATVSAADGRTFSTTDGGATWTR